MPELKSASDISTVGTCVDFSKAPHVKYNSIFKYFRKGKSYLKNLLVHVEH